MNAIVNMYKAYRRHKEQKGSPHGLQKMTVHKTDIRPDETSEAAEELRHGYVVHIPVPAINNMFVKHLTWSHWTFPFLQAAKTKLPKKSITFFNEPSRRSRNILQRQ